MQSLRLPYALFLVAATVPAFVPQRAAARRTSLALCSL
jgi:hypothetical protein